MELIATLLALGWLVYGFGRLLVWAIGGAMKDTRKGRRQWDS